MFRRYWVKSEGIGRAISKVIGHKKSWIWVVSGKIHGESNQISDFWIEERPSNIEYEKWSRKHEKALKWLLDNDCGELGDTSRAREEGNRYDEYKAKNGIW